MWKEVRQYVAKVQQKTCLHVPQKWSATNSQFQENKKWFDGKAEQGRRGRILTGREISQNLRNFNNDFGNFKRSASKRKRIQSTDLSSDVEALSSESEEEEEEEEEVQVDEDELSRWKKRSIFFRLPYWEV